MHSQHGPAFHRWIALDSPSGDSVFISARTSAVSALGVRGALLPRARRTTRSVGVLRRSTAVHGMVRSFRQHALTADTATAPGISGLIRFAVPTVGHPSRRQA